MGRRNVGKSTFVNTLAGADRMITSEVPGTPRDSVDVRFELDGKGFVAIDTPGIRRTRAQQKFDIDFYGAHRAQRCGTGRATGPRLLGMATVLPSISTITLCGIS